MPRPPLGLLSPDLTASRRRRAVDEVDAGHVADVLVIGGGVTGCGVALDAASRGLDVVLVEAHDLAFGTSRWSSKLVHGGLRYLAHGDLAVAWESAVERAHLMSRIAPHLVRPLPHVMPAPASAAERTLVRSGLAAADALRLAARTPRGILARARTIGPAEAQRLVPALDGDRFAAATVHWDGQLVDDARLVVALARTAARYGARIITRAQVTTMARDGARVRLVGDRDIDVRARHVVVAAGVWTTDLDPSTQLTASRGSHALVRSAALGHPRAALTVQVPGERSRYVFALPTLDGPVIAGITDEEVAGPIPNVPQAPPDDVAWILDQLSHALARPLSTEDVVGSYAGLRPLVAEPGAPSADISRHHVVHDRDGVVVVTGGKLTTYRRMAQDAVDALGVAGPCVTAHLPLVGALPRRSPSPPGIPARLRARYGAEAPRVLAHADGDPTLLEPLARGIPFLGVEVVHAMRCEGALDLDDVVDRRTRIAMADGDREGARLRAANIVDSLAGPMA